MRGNDVVGLIFANMHDEQIHELTGIRTMASVPFGGRYRFIDFSLSSMVNSGITKVGVITKSNYQSLMDHLGSGKAWDLSRKRDGLIILPPFGQGNALYHDRVEALKGIFDFLYHCNENHVLMADCDIIANIDYSPIIRKHVEENNDVTIAYKYDKLPKKRKDNMVLSLDSTGKITNIDIDPPIEGSCNFGLNIYVVKKQYLIRIIENAITRSRMSFLRDCIQANLNSGKFMAYPIDTYVGVIQSLESYFKITMDLLNQEVREQLFPIGRPVYTKVRDDMPAVYGLNSHVTNSLIADGCIIDGEVENSVLFRGVKVGKGAKVSNSIIIQGSDIGDNCNLNYVITDKNVVIKEARTLMGYDTYPVFISKNSVV